MKRIKPQPPKRAVFKVLLAVTGHDRISLVLTSPDAATMPLPDIEIVQGGRIVLEELDKVGVMP